MARRRIDPPTDNAPTASDHNEEAIAKALARIEAAAGKPSRKPRSKPATAKRAPVPAAKAVDTYKGPRRTHSPPPPPAGADDPEWRAGRKAAILVHLEETGDTIGYSARKCGVSKSALYKWRAADEGFRQALREAYDAGTDNLEQEAKVRATKGALRPVFHNGEIVGHVRHKSDFLLKFLLMARDPRFRGLEAPPPPANAPQAGSIVITRQQLDALPLPLMDALIQHLTVSASR